MKKIKMICVSLFMMFVSISGVFAQTITPKLTIIDEASNPNWKQDIKIDSTHAFTIGSHSGEEPLGQTVNCEDTYFYEFGWTDAKYCFVAKKGNGLIYKKVGTTTNGKDVDLKIELGSFTKSQELHEGYESGYIGFSDKYIGSSLNNLSQAVFKFTFLDSETQKPIKLNGFISFGDLDAYQYISVNSDDGNVNTWYIVEEKENKDITNNVTNTNSEKNWAPLNDAFNSASCNHNKKDHTGLYNLTGNSYTFIARGAGLNGNALNGFAMATYDDTSSFTVTFGNCRTTSNSEFFGVGTSVLKVEMQEPYKTVAKDKVEIGEDFTYTISQYIPWQRTENYYSAYVLTDTLEDYLEAPKSEDIKVTDRGGKDVTDQFTIEVDGQTIKATAKNVAKAEFYGQTYNFLIPTKVKDSISDNLFDSNNNYTIPNHATSTATYKDGGGTEKKDTDIVTITVHREPQIVTVPKTFASSLLFIVIGLILVIIAAYVIYVVISKKKANKS